MSKEAMKLALEALEHTPTLSPAVEELCDAAITALREALAEQPAQQEPVAWNQTTAELASIYGEMCAINETPSKDQSPEQIARLKVLRSECVGIHHRRIALNTTPLAAPVQEPVALRDALAGALSSVYVCGRVWDAWSVGTMTEDDFQPAAECDELLDELVSIIATPPAQRKPLTDEEIGAMWVTARRNSPLPHVIFARAIESKLKEKNNG